MPDGYSCTVSGQGSDASPIDATVAFAEDGTGRQTLNAGFIGNHHPATPAETYGWILGTTWSDGDGDGLKDEGHGLTDVEIRLLDASGNQVASARTGHHDWYSSLYLFGPLLPGKYSLVFTPPDDYTFTTAGGDSSADPTTGSTGPFTVAGGDVVTRDAGLVLSITPSSTAGAGGADGPEDGGAGAVENVTDGGSGLPENESAAGEEEGMAKNGTDEVLSAPVVNETPPVTLPPEDAVPEGVARDPPAPEPAGALSPPA